MAMNADHFHTHDNFKIAGKIIDQVSALKQRNAELEKELENVRNTYNESVEVKVKIWERCKKAEDTLEKTERRLRRALWISRAKRAEARKNYWYARSCHEGDKDLWSIDGSAVKYIGCIKRTNFDWLKTWSEVEGKCRAMADKFK